MKRWWPVMVGAGLVLVGAVLAVVAWPAGVTLDGMQMQGQGAPPVWPSPVPSAVGLTLVVVGVVVAVLGWWRPSPGRVSTWVWGLSASLIAAVAANDAFRSGQAQHLASLSGAWGHLAPGTVVPVPAQVLVAGWVLLGSCAAVVVCLLMTVVVALRSLMRRRVEDGLDIS